MNEVSPINGQFRDLSILHLTLLGLPAFFISFKF
uniref:Uncharacterized protein n=1 Tax=Tetranychus urticae TaxID=32264 RepID=T1KR39_TETUR